MGVRRAPPASCRWLALNAQGQREVWSQWNLEGLRTVATTPPVRPQVRNVLKEMTNDDDAARRSKISRWTLAANVSIVGLFALAVIAALYLARPVAVPVVLAIIVGTILGPIVSHLESYGIPRVASTIVIVLLLLGVFVILTAALTAPLTEWIGKASQLGSLLRSRFQDFGEPVKALQELYRSLQSLGGASGETGNAIRIEASPDTSIVQTAISILTPALSQLLIAFVSTIFYLIFKNDFKGSAVLVFSTRETRLRAIRVFNDTETNLARYFATFTAINAVLGALTTLAMWIVGMPNPLLWGVLAAVLNYLPYLGPAIVTIALIVASLLSFPTLGEAVLPPIIYTVVHVLEGEFVTPSILAYSLAVNPFFLFLSVVFWTWLWGPIGAFLAVPIAMIIVSVVEHVGTDAEKPSLP
ncbi:MAG: AI-2E family transporter [Rhodomicrobiaceae bacterium]